MKKLIVLLSGMVVFSNLFYAQATYEGLDTTYCVVLSQGSVGKVKNDHKEFMTNSLKDSFHITLTMFLDANKSYLIVDRDWCKSKNYQKGVLYKIRKYMPNAKLLKCSELKGTHREKHEIIYYD